MENFTQTRPTLRQISATLAGAGLLVGFLVALGVLSGDVQGRVNLLYLLLLFAFLPVAGLLLSLVFLLRDSARGLAGLVLDLPFWPRPWQRRLFALGGGGARRHWYFYQSQLLALSFGLGGLAAFFILLVGSDVSFVWRSTLLEAGDLLPALRLLALPWLFWPEAQPSLELLQRTQDFRLAEPDFDAATLGSWWKYVLAAQCTYNLLPRSLMLLAARRRYLRASAAASVAPAPPPLRKRLNSAPSAGHLAPLVHEVEEGWTLVDWAGAPDFCLDWLQSRLGAPAARLRAGPLAGAEEEEASLVAAGQRVVLVKSWEPPMGELRDYLERADGLLLPLDWEEREVRPVRDVHLQEWRRFCGTLPHWRVLQPAPAEVAA